MAEMMLMMGDRFMVRIMAVQKETRQWRVPCG